MVTGHTEEPQCLLWQATHDQPRLTKENKLMGVVMPYAKGLEQIQLLKHGMNL